MPSPLFITGEFIMTFEEKVTLIEKARKDYPDFNQEFIEYLGLGYSFNGAYNHFTIDNIKKYEKTSEIVVKPVEVVKPATVKPTTSAKTTITAKN